MFLLELEAFERPERQALECGGCGGLGVQGCPL
jgi:hypothetical protein